MTVNRVYTFSNIGSLTLETKVPSPQRSNSEAPADLTFTISQLISFLENNGFLVLPASSAMYLDDDDAATNGVAINSLYWLHPLNNYGIPTPPGGSLTRRKA